MIKYKVGDRIDMRMYTHEAVILQLEGDEDDDVRWVNRKLRTRAFNGRSMSGKIIDIDPEASLRCVYVVRMDGPACETVRVPEFNIINQN